MTEHQLITPEPLWAVDEEYRDYYEAGVAEGRRLAGEGTAAIVSICRNAMPVVVNTLPLVAAVQHWFSECSCYLYENDSADDTDKMLDKFAELCPWVAVEHETLGVVDTRGFEKERTERLAACRNKCLEWVRQNAADTDWTIVLDIDPAGGFSVDGVYNSIARLAERPWAGGMASYSLAKWTEGVSHYDAWAARPNWWRDRRDEIGFTWFQSLMPPVGSPPIAMNSAFGGLAVYRTKSFLTGGYTGEDCEHVGHHKRMREAGWPMYLNPGSRYIAVWRDE